MLASLLALTLVAQVCTGLDAGCSIPVVQCTPPDSGVLPDATVGDAGVAPSTAATISMNIAGGGGSRSVLEVVTASAAAAGRATLAVVLPGCSWTTIGAREMRLEPVVGDIAVVWLYTQGLATAQCPDGRGAASPGWDTNQRERDLTFLRGIVANARARRPNIDRVVIIGRSHGGGMAQAAASDVTIGAHGVVLVVPFHTGPDLSRNVRVLHVANRSDRIVGSAGGIGWVERAAASNGCAMFTPSMPTSPAVFRCSNATGCPAGRGVRSCIAESSAHDAPWFFPQEVADFLRTLRSS